MWLKSLELRLHRGDDARMVMAGVEHGNAGGEIDVALALDVPDLGVQRPVGKYRRLRPETARRLACRASSSSLFVVTGFLHQYQSDSAVSRRGQEPRFRIVSSRLPAKPLAPGAAGARWPRGQAANGVLGYDSRLV